MGKMEFENFYQHDTNVYSLKGFQPVAGFSFGAKKYNRIKKSYYFTVILGIFLVITVILSP